jgi:GNAT superfamily N-acetyltransferase
MTTSTTPASPARDITIRPIKATDIAMEAEFIRRLSPRSRHFRFMGGVRELSQHELEKLCDVDGNHSVAYVATVRGKDGEEEVGVSRYAPDSRPDEREMAVTVADEWQHKGIGTMLVQRLVQSARNNGVKRLYSIDLADNTEMAALARDLGMSVETDPDDRRQVIYSLRF